MPPIPQPPPLPIVLELAPVGREKAGPFLVLGVAKTATKNEVEEHWAKRLIWARKKQVGVPLEDINWAREVLSDPDRRLLADAGSLNIDPPDGLLAQLAGHRPLPPGASAGQPLDVEVSLADFAPEVDLPDIDELRRSVRVPDVPREFPTVSSILQALAQEPLDPWMLDLEDASGE